MMQIDACEWEDTGQFDLSISGRHHHKGTWHIWRCRNCLSQLAYPHQPPMMRCNAPQGWAKVPASCQGCPVHCSALKTQQAEEVFLG